MKHIILPLFKQLLPIIFLGQFLHGCFLVPEEESVSSSTCTTDCSSTTSTSGAENTGVFVDSAVAGVTYTTSSGLSGTTNSSGEFSYRSGDTASFSIGDINLGSVTASAVLTPVEVMGASGTADPKVINLARLLQTLDSDGDPTNGIEITSATSNTLKGKSLNFNVAVDTFTNDSTIAQIQTTVGRTLTSATAALNHLHTTLNSRSLSSKVSPDNQFQGLSSTLSSFSFTPTNTLVGASLARLRATLEGLNTLSATQIDKIVSAGKTKLTSDGLSSSENPTTALPSLLSGAMTGIGQAQLGSDNLTNQVINPTVSVITSLIGKFENQLALTSSSSQSTSQGLALTSGTTEQRTSTDQLSRSDGVKLIFESLLSQLMETAIKSLDKTGLSNDALDEGLGEVVGAMVSSLDEAKTNASQMGSAIQTLTKKAVQKAASVPGLDASKAIQSVTKNAVKGLANTKMSAEDVTATISTAVETVMDSLDEVEGASNLSISSLSEQVTASSLDGLANLQQNFANDSSFDVSQAVNKIAGGAAKGARALKQQNPNFDLADTLGKVSQSAASNLSKVTSDPSIVSKMAQGIQGGIDAEVAEISKADPSLAEQIKQKTKIPEFCNFDGKKISGYGDPSSQVLAYFSKTVGFGQTCISQTRTCDKGELSGSYLHSSCVVQAPATCLLEGQTIAHDKKIKTWENKEVPFGNACKSQERNCTNGTLSGSYSHLSCIVQAPQKDPNRPPVVSSLGPFIVPVGKTTNQKLIDNVTDPDNDLLVFYINNSKTRGALKLNDNKTGNLTYTAPSSSGPDNFTYWVIDNHSNKSNIGLVQVNVVPDNLEQPSDNNTTFVVKVSGGKYLLDGVQRKTLTLKRGHTYNFDTRDQSTDNHPLYLGTSSASDNYKDEYTSGVTNSRTRNKILTIVVPGNAPNTLYYNCGLHPNMGAAITIVGGTALEPTVPPTIVSTHPAQNANNIVVTDNITINFSTEILDRSVVDQVVVRDGNRDVMGETDTQGKVVIFKPRSAFSPGTSYSVTVKTGITDTAGTALASEITWNFNTAPATNHYSACVGDCDTYWEIYDQNRSWPIEIETLDPSMNLNTTVVYPDPTAYFDNKTNNIPGQSYLVDKWMNRTEIKICMMFDFDDVDNLTSSRVEELRLAIEDGFWLWQRGLLGFKRINRNRMEVKITKIVARNANWISEPANIPINNNGKKGSPEGCGGVSIPGTAEGALSAEEGDFDYKFSFHDDICALGCAAAGVAGWKENILSYPADWDKDGKLEDWQGVRAYYPNIVHEMNAKNNFLLFHEIGHLTRLGDCVFPEIASIMCGNTWPPHKDFQNNGDHKTRPTPYDYAWLRKNYSINN